MVEVETAETVVEPQMLVPVVLVDLQEQIMAQAAEHLQVFSAEVEVVVLLAEVKIEMEELAETAVDLSGLQVVPDKKVAAIVG